MDFRTKIQLPPGKFSMNQNQRITLIGSCFAEEVGKRLESDKFPCDLNPFGVLYNPLSIAQALQQLLDNKIYEEKDLFFEGGLWHSWMHHSSFSAPTSEECLKRVNFFLLTGEKNLPNWGVLILTLGSNRFYRYKKTGQVVGNCHKVPEKEFEVEDLSVSEIVSALLPVLERLHEVNPKLQVLFTVSPIRYLKYGLHESMLGKSVLLLAANELQQRHPDYVHYFPAFEIMLDDLRDYRFYAPDMVHPSDVAVDYIYECFKACYFDKIALAVSQEWKEIDKALHHKPFNPESESYKLFIAKTKTKIEQLSQKYPLISVQKELELCNTILDKL